ncbi:MAG: hypothetical protein EA397_09905 [Deltaproteobacteria bacterium]|nr:MAG: hypothetical protein EA397_09905 [Deltaproteobacteria bacterium]
MFRTLPLLLFFACGDGTDAVDQEFCEISVNAGATLLTDDQVIGSGAADLLICGAGGAVINGGERRIIVTSGGEAVVNASGAEIWILDGGAAVLNGGGASVWREPSASITGNIAPQSTTVCGSIVLDLSALPSGC